MAETQVTTSEAQIHTPATEYSDLDYFTYPAIFSAMADSVKKHDPELFKSCADSIDMGHVSTLRGLSYLGQLLAGDDRVPGRGVRGHQEVMDSGMAGMPVRVSRRTG